MGSWRTSSEYRSELTSVYLAIFRAEDELDDKLKSQEKELRKISTGSSLGKVFLDTVRQREKINAGKRERETGASHEKCETETLHCREKSFR